MADVNRAEPGIPKVDSTALRWAKQFAMIFAIWTGIGLLVAGQLHFLFLETHHPKTWAQVLIPSLLTRWIFALLTPGVLWLSSRFPFGRGHWLSSLGAHALGVFGFLIIWVGIRVPLNPVFDPLPGPNVGSSWSLFHDMLLEHAYYALWMYGSLVAISQVWEYYRKYRERELRASRLEAELAQAQLKVMRMQLDPHFLFATLDSISTLMHEDVEAADDLVAHLSDLLRMSLETMDEAEITLKREMDFLKTYLGVQEVRLRGQLTVQMTLAPDSLDALVPATLLSSLVENVIQYGVGSAAPRVRIDIRFEVREGTLCIEILDNVPCQVESSGTLRATDPGVAHARMRLQRLYPNSHLCARQVAPGGGSRLTLEMPFKVESDSPPEQPEIQTVNEAR
jgi:hypothetical protein